MFLPAYALLFHPVLMSLHGRLLPMHAPIYPRRGSAALRRGRCSEQGRIYLVTFTTHRRARLYDDWTCARAVARALHERRLWRDSILLCWVLMPDHWHGLVQLAGGDTLSTLIGRVKTVTARAARTGNTSDPVWSSGYHDHALRRDEQCIAVARYIVANPVRAGLCDLVGEYPFWDAIWLKG